MYSNVHKQRPKADDFFAGAPQYANQTDVLLTSASDLETNVMNKGRLKRISSGCLLINVQDCIYNVFIYFIHILLYTP